MITALSWLILPSPMVIPMQPPTCENLQEQLAEDRDSIPVAPPEYLSPEMDPNCGADMTVYQTKLVMRDTTDVRTFKTVDIERIMLLNEEMREVEKD